MIITGIFQGIIVVIAFFSGAAWSHRRTRAAYLEVMNEEMKRVHQELLKQAYRGKTIIDVEATQRHSA